MSTAPDSTTPPAPRRSGNALAWLIVLIALVAAAWFGWRWWQADRARSGQLEARTAERIDTLEARLERLRTDQRAQAQRLQQADATNRVLRDELLGLGQRAALIEDSVSKLADPERNGAQALRLDELEIVLGLAQQRLHLAGDLDGARHAYALAASLLDGIHDPGYLSLRQTLTQERSAIDALKDDPRAVAAGRLDAFAASLPALPEVASAPGAESAPWWRRAIAQLVDIRPTSRALAITPEDRAAGLAALQLELSLAQAAVERRDVDGYRAALARADAWLPRLWPDSAALRQRRATLRELRALNLKIALPTLGTTLDQLRATRSAR